MAASVGKGAVNSVKGLMDLARSGSSVWNALGKAITGRDQEAQLRAQGYKPTLDVLTNAIVGKDFADIGPLELGDQFAPEGKIEEYLLSGSEGVGEFLPFAVTGGSSAATTTLGRVLASGVKEAGKGALLGLGKQGAKDAGFGEFGQTMVGIAATFSPQAAKALVAKGPGIFKSGKSAATEYWNALTKPSEGVTGANILTKPGSKEAIAEATLLGNKKRLQDRVRKITTQELETFDTATSRLPDGGYREGIPLGTENAPAILTRRSIEERTQAAIKSTLDEVGPELSNKQLWTKIRDRSKDLYKQGNEANRALFNQAKQIAVGKKVRPNHTYNRVKGTIKDINKSLAQGAEEKSVKGVLQELKSNLTNWESVEKQAQDLVEIGEYTGERFDLNELIDTISEFSSAREVTLEQLMATDRSIRYVLQSEGLTKSVKNLLNSAKDGIKEDIIAAFGGLESEGYKTYESAMEMRKLIGQTFEGNSMMTLMESEAPEMLANTFNYGSNRDRLYKVVAGDLEIRGGMNRIIADNAVSQPPGLRTKYLNEYEDLDPMVRKAVSEVTELEKAATDPYSKAASRARVEESVFQSIQDAALTGARPQRALTEMKTFRGRALVKDMLSTSPEGRNIYQGLLKMTGQDLVASITTKQGALNYAAARQVARSPEGRSLIKEVWGDEGVRFFEKAGAYQENIGKALETIETLGTGEKMLQRLQRSFTEVEPSIGTAALLSLIGPKAWTLMGVTKGIPAAQAVHARVLASRILAKPEAQEIITNVGSKSLSMGALEDYISRLLKIAMATADEIGDLSGLTGDDDSDVFVP